MPARHALLCSCAACVRRHECARVTTADNAGAEHVLSASMLASAALQARQASGRALRHSCCAAPCNVSMYKRACRQRNSVCCWYEWCMSAGNLACMAAGLIGRPRHTRSLCGRGCDPGACTTPGGSGRGAGAAAACHAPPASRAWRPPGARGRKNLAFTMTHVTGQLAAGAVSGDVLFGVCGGGGRGGGGGGYAYALFRGSRALPAE